MSENTPNAVTLLSGRVVTLSSYLAAWRKLQGMTEQELIGTFQPGAAANGAALPYWIVLQWMKSRVHERINAHLPGYGRGRKWRKRPLLLNE